MKDKINIAELLKNCPSGMELDCTMYESVTFVRVDMSRKQFPIEIAVGGIRSKYLTKEGCFHDTTLSPESKCVIFPKGKTTWEGFQRPFVEGDVVSTEHGIYIGIVKSTEDSHLCYTFCSINDKGDFFIDDDFLFSRLATEEEKEKLFKVIKDNGYRWNEETKTLEKLGERKFKNGDIIVFENHWGPFISIFKENVTERNGFIGHCVLDVDDNEFKVKDSAMYFNKARFATKREKEQLFRAIEKNGYKWNEETKTLENLFSYNIGKKVWVKSDKEHKYVHTIVGISRNFFGNLEYEVKEEKSGVVVHYPESLLIPITTKELKFKVGDRIRHKCPEFRGERIITNCNDTGYFTTINDWIDIAHQDDWELINEPKFKIGDTITNGKTSITIGYIDNECYYEISRNIATRLFIKNQDEWKLISEKFPNKFNINTLIPFESRVLVRGSDPLSEWKPAIFGIYRGNKHYSFYVVGGTCWKQCIPFEGNEHLLGTTNDCNEYYKTWK